MAKSIRKSVKKASTKAVKSSHKRSTVNVAKKPAQKNAKVVKASPKFRSHVPRSASNPFREGSSYGIAFDILASKPEGMPRAELVAQLAKATGKPLKNASFDAGVVLSARPHARHQSCRLGFNCIKENQSVRLEVTAAPPTAGK